MKKLTLVLLTVCFAVSLQAQQPTGLNAQLQRYKTFKTQQMPSYSLGSDHSSILSTKAGAKADTLLPEAALLKCGSEGGQLKVSMWAFTFPETTGNTYAQYIAGSNSNWQFAQTYFPRWYSENDVAVMGANRAVTGVVLLLTRIKSPICPLDSVPTTMSLYKASRQEFFGATSEDIVKAYAPKGPGDKLCVSEVVNIAETEEEGLVYEFAYNFPCAYPVADANNFTLYWELPLDSTLIIASGCTELDCVGDDLNAALVINSRENFIGTGGGLYLPDDNPQYDNGSDIIFSPMSAYFINPSPLRIEMLWLPIINDITANEDMSSIDLKAAIYPIPAATEITLVSSYKMNDVKIYNAAGQLVKSVKASGDHTEFIDVTSLTNGTYIAKIDTKEGVITKKIIIKK